MIRHFSTNKLTSPILSISIGYTYVITLALILYILGFYSKSSFFTWGVPVTFMGVLIDNYGSYFGLLICMFIHQLVNNWINSTVYPWIINCVQDEKSVNLLYSKKVTLLLINMFDLYSEIDMVFIVSGMISQVAFVLVIVLANVISTTLVNWQYIKMKTLYDFDEYSIV